MIPNFSQYLEEGMLSTYRTEKEGQKLNPRDLKVGFVNIVEKLIDERIPFYFDCVGKCGQRIGYLMNDSINGEKFNGHILDDKASADKTKKEFESLLEDLTVLKPGKLHIGRCIFSDLTRANDLDTILVVVKAFKAYKKEKNIEGRVITGNKYEVCVNIDYICDSNNANNIMDFVF